jgi:hypothetical protein
MKEKGSHWDGVCMLQRSEVGIVWRGDLFTSNGPVWHVIRAGFLRLGGDLGGDGKWYIY